VRVILRKPVRKLGHIGDIVNVKPGFARNYLIPNEMAIMATKSNEEFFAHQKEELLQKHHLAVADAKILAQKVDGKTFIFVRQAGSDGKLFGSVSSKDIARELSEFLCSSVNFSSVLIEAPIKSIGSLNVEVALHHDVIANILVIIARSEAEGKSFIADLAS
jgi:large subunit ribosomal protein L9